jgi:chromatin remodeling complex protein RSC6
MYMATRKSAKKAAKKTAKRPAKKTAKKAAKKTAKRGAAKTAKRGAAKKTTRRSAAKKSTARRGAAKKTARKAAKKSTAKKSTRKTAKKSTAKKSGRKRAPNPAFMKPMTPSSDLAAVVGDSPMPRTEITKKVWAYIKRNGLQDARERRMINADDKLKRVFGGKNKVSMFEMTALVNKHLK